MNCTGGSAATGNPLINEYGDLPPGINNASTSGPTHGSPSRTASGPPSALKSRHEDYLVFGTSSPYRNDLDPGPPGGNPLDPQRPGRGNNVRQGITQADYEAYINWNHPGDKAALIARAGNGQYDGPERWTEDRQTKVVLAPVTTLATAEPMPSPAGNWGGDPFGFPTWQDWWNAAFGSPAVAWGGLVANAVAYVPDYGRRADGWIPSTSWGFDGDREFCDLPSSMYHLGGDPLSVTAANYDPLLGFLRTDAAAAGAPMGDGFIGEITSPWANTVYGEGHVDCSRRNGNPDWIGRP
ncbi:MAG: hypothetical protein U1G05_16165 [Kiritimatiellia bacterium]